MGERRAIRPSGAGAAAGLLGAMLCSSAPALAQEDILGRQTLHGFVEVGLAAADGERSWTDGGFGKTQFSGDSRGGWDADAGVRQAVVEWRPSFGFLLDGVASAQWQPDTDPRVDLNEAYLRIKAPPSPIGALSARAGVFYPPVSLEHDGVAWTTEDLLSASAIGSWIGEEVKVGGVEATLRRRIGDHEVAVTGGLFKWNDTSGTLLTYRGWALHGVRTGVRTEFELPPLSPFMHVRQADETYPMWEMDHRVGYYGRFEWRPPAPVTIEAFHYDNRGDRIAVRDLQWAWETRFSTLGARWEPDASTRLQAQALTGRTWMGYATPEVWADVSFRAAYLMASRSFGEQVASARLDWFEAEDHTFEIADNNDETGWAATLGLRFRLTPHFDVLLEAQQVRSKRPSRALADEAPKQSQRVLQSALRMRF